MEPGFQLFPDQASTVAPRVDALYGYLLGVAVFFTLLIFFSIVFLALYYRRSAGRHRPGARHGRMWMLEATWIVVPLLLAMGMFTWGAEIFFDMRTMPAGAVELQVVGKQWMWKIQHPQGRSEINELHVPIGRPIVLRMISEDVIHSFYVPAFRVKMDVLPDRYSTLWFEATQPGTYHLFCAEYCGTGHAAMSGRVIAMQPADYAQWLASGEATPVASAGEELFTRLRCHTCHHTGSQPRCPPLENLFGNPVQLASGQIVTADAAYIRESILNPNAKVVAGYQPVMPTYEGQVSEEQIFQLVDYIKSLSAAPAAAGGGQVAPPESASGHPSE